MNVESVAIDAIHPDPANLRKHNSRNVDAIKASLARFGQQTPIVVDPSGVIRKGNGTYAAAKELGWTEIKVVRTPLKGTEATAYAIADNRTQDLSEFDTEGLAETLRALQEEEFDLSAVGFTDEEVDDLFGGMATEADGDAATDDDSEDGYKEQYGVIVVCEDEESQKAIYERLMADGYNCRVVVT